MKKSVWMVAVCAAMVVGMVTGCFTSAKAYTRVHPDGTRESFVRIVGTGDKASEIAAEGLFADGSESDFGAGVEQAKAKQQSTGIKEAFEGVNGLLLGVGQVLARAQGAPAYGSEGETAYSAEGETAYSAEGYGGAPGAGGEGVYGRPGCPRCQAYAAAHPGVEIVNIDQPANSAAMWAALRARGYTGRTAALPVLVTADGYTLNAK